MRVALVLAAAVPVALGACKVDVEGAPCRVAGSTAECPAGQACGPAGADGLGRCSKHVGGCVAAGTFCTPGDERGGHRCSGSRLETCVPGDDCGVWALAEDCGEFFCDAARDLCRCPDAPPGAFAVDPTPLPPGGHAPSGAAAPPACRFRSLTQALGLAKVLVSNDPAATATVTALGAAAGTTVAFSAAGSGEAFPLEVPGRVTLTSDAASSGGTYEILFDGTASAAAPVTLGAGATLARFTVRNGRPAGDTEDRALVLDCGTSTEAVSLDHVLLDGTGVGGNRLDAGIRVDGPCGLSATGLDVRGMAEVGIALTHPAATVTLSGGTIGGSEAASGNGTGISVQNGTLVASTTRVEGNEGIGIDANASFTGSVAVELSGVKVLRNGDTGIAVRNPTALAMVDTTVFGNSAATSWGQGLYTPRRCGGLVLWGAPPAADRLEFQHNRVYANAGDQVVVLGSGTATWALQPSGAQPACAASGEPLFNTFSCYDTSAPPTGQVSYRGLVALSASASVVRAVWQSETPSADDVHVWGSGTVTLAPWCPPDPSLRCTSEDPVLP